MGDGRITADKLRVIIDHTQKSPKLLLILGCQRISNEFDLFLDSVQTLRIYPITQVFNSWLHELTFA